MPLFWERTYRSDTAADFHAWWLKRRGLVQGCAFFENFSHCSPFRGSKTPKNLQFLGVNRRFQAKLAKSKNVHIFNTTASIPTKFCTMLKTTKCPSWVVPAHALQIQDGGRLPSWKNRKIAIFRPRFDRFSRNLARWCSSTLLTVPALNNLKFWKSKMASAAILDFRNFKFLTLGTVKRSNYVIIPNFVKIGPNAAEILRFIIFQDGGRRHLGF